MSFADLKAQARRVVHANLAVPVTYLPPETGSTPVVGLNARHRTRETVHGDVGNEYATIQEGVNRLVFSVDELTAAGVTLKRKGRVYLSPFILELDQREPRNGEVEESWSVVDVTVTL